LFIICIIGLGECFATNGNFNESLFDYKVCMVQQPVFIVKTFQHIDEGAITPTKMHRMVFCFSHRNCSSNFPHQHNNIWTLSGGPWRLPPIFLRHENSALGNIPPKGLDLTAYSKLNCVCIWIPSMRILSFVTPNLRAGYGWSFPPYSSNLNVCDYF
jgi:hypothetical protein